MKSSRLPRSSPEQIREWRRRSVKTSQERARQKYDYPVRSIGSNRERRKKEWARSYGSEERVVWIQAQKCVFCGRTPSENAHVKSGGTGRKSDAEYVVPACGDREGPHGLVRGCHWEMDHGIGKRAMERKYNVDLLAEARRVEREWRER